MTKLIMVFFAAVAAIQLIRPLGWPGLEHRRDAWKLALLALVIVGIFVLGTAALQAS
ncbi:hypothetical protein [Rhodobium gokarnense]|uniref:Uncharacterized protein n=1 Tax=Rhodobium gokarnense TaxID=364296 RepID=A0ABT3HD05_9HYPH|nr:hypothetical protein [Rhodobium gokarnense]MCW2308292.1 hypothetical protein [Rhodobium gokarnense]